MKNKGECYLFGVDIGTSSSKGAIINNSGKVLAEAMVEHDINIIKPGWVEQDPEKCYWGDFKEITKTLLKRTQISPEDIVGIGVSSLAPDIIPIDKDGNVIRPAIIYMDRRASAECEELERELGSEGVVQKTGNIADPYYAGYKLEWYMRNEPENYKRTYKVLNADKFVTFRLTGRAIIDHTTAMIFAPYYDPRKGEWSHEISELVGGGIEKLPDLYLPHEVVGHVTSEAAKATGLKAGTPVIAAGPDAIVSAYSVGMVNEGESCFMYGTTGCWFTIIDKPIYDKRLIATRHVVPGKYIIGGGMIATGGLVKWFRDNFGHVERSMADMLNVSAYQLLDQEAEKVPPGSDGLVVLPYFLGERTPIWDIDAKGLIFGLSLSHTRAHIFRSLMEAGGYGLRHHLDIAGSLGVKIKDMLAVNGGARSRLWRQIISDITGVPQYYVHPVPGAPYGDAFLAGIGTGVFKRFEDLKNYVQIKEKTEPNSKNHELYSKLYQIYLNLYPKVKDDYKTLSKIISS